MLSAALKRYDHVVLQHPLLTVLIVGLLLAFSMFGLTRSEFDASADSLVLEGDKDLIYSREIGELYQSEDFLLVTYKSPDDLFDDKTLARLKSLRDALAKVEGVAGVTSILDVPLLYSPQITVADLDEPLRTLEAGNVDKTLAAQEFLTSPIYESLLTNGDNSVTVLQISLQRDNHYFELLGERTALRKLRRDNTITPQQSVRLKQVEADFSDYSLVIAARQHKLVGDIRAILADYQSHATMFLGGVPMVTVDMIKFVKDDLAVFGSAILLFIIVAMWLIFRSVRWVVLPLLICSASAASLLGLFGWLDWRLTVISSNLVAILLIVNLAILVHLIVCYREMQFSFPNETQHQLVRRTVKRMFKPCVFTTLTTLVAFASLVASGIRPVIDFGWMMCLGVTVALILSFVLFPALLLLCSEKQVRHGSSVGAPVTLRFARVVDKHSRVIGLVTVIALVASVVGISQLKVENRFIDYFHEDTEIHQGMLTIDEELGGSIPLEIIIDATQEQLVTAGLLEDDFNVVEDIPLAVSDNDAIDDAEFDSLFGDDFGDEELGDDFASSGDEQASSVWFTVAGMQQVARVHAYLESLPETGKVLSLATLYKVIDDVMEGGVDDIQLSLVRDQLPAIVNDVMVAPYYNAEQNQARISVRVKETSETLQRDDFLKQVHANLTQNFGLEPSQVHLTGMLVLYNNMLQSLYRSQILTLAVVFVAITLMFVVLFRSLKLALIGVAPNMLVAFLVLGGMGWLGIPLDMMTITIAAIGIGIGVDNNIHYIHRFGKEFQIDGDYQAAMYRCHGSIGKAVFYTSSIIVIGFSVLVLSNFTPSIYFGLLTSVAMFSALMGALLLLPCLLIWCKPFGPEHSTQPL